MSSTTSSSSDSEDNVLIIRTPKVYNAHVTNFDLWTDHEFFERLSKDVTRHVLDHIKDQISAPSNTFRRAILSNPDILSSTSWINLLENDFWGTPLSDSGSHGSYRPFCVFTFRLNYILGGFQPWGYHLVNVLLHVLATGLVVRVARTVLPPGNVGPAMTGLFFASHPIHTEAVAGIVGRADLAACNFYLISFLTYVLHVKYRDNLCLRVFPRVYRYCCDKRQNNIESTKYRNFFNYLRKQVTHVANTTTPNEFCCMRHNFVLPALSTFNTTSRHNIFDVFDDKSSVPSDEKKFCCKCTIPDNLCVVRAVKQWLAFAGCVLCAAGAMLSKETGISVLVVCALYDRIHTSSRGSTKRKNRSLFFLIISLLLLIGLRLYVTSGTTPTFATADNPTSKAASITTRFLTFTYLPCFNFFILLCPISLSFDWSMDAIPRITTIFDSRNIISLFFYFTFYKVLNITYTQLSKQKTKDLKNETNKYRRKELPIFYEAPCPCTVCHHNLFDHHSQICRTNNNNNSLPSSMCLCKRSSPVIQKKDNKLKYPYATILMACAFLALPFLPATNLFFYVGFVVAERVLYLPSVGYCLLVSLGVVRACKYKKYGKFVCFLVVFLLIIFCARTIRRNRDWRDEENLYRSAITINPPKAYGNLGSVLSSQGKIAEAEWAYNKALEYRTNMADVHYNLGILLQGRKQYDDAIRSYQRAIHFRPSLALAYVNLGGALVAAGRCQEAVSILRQGSQLDGTGLKDRRTHESAKVSALLQLGALYADQGRLQRALAAYREALHTMPKHFPPQSVYNLLGETLTRLHQFDEAERWYQAALQAQPDHVPAHITYGKLLAKNSSRVVEAEQWFRRAQRLAPGDASVYHHYGEFLASLQRHSEAAVQYVKAAELKPQDYELIVAAATALRQAERRQEAEQWYRMAVQLQPTDARGHTNLGAILHLNGKYSEAVSSYREALRLQPDDVTTLTNLHKLYTLMA